MNKAILVSAYGCEPNKGSEPGLGWDWVSELANYNKVIVITRSNNRTAIEAVNKNENLVFYYYDVPKKYSFWKKGEKGIYLYYYMWQLGCYKLAKKIYDKEKIDLAIAMTFGTVWLPTFLYKLPCKFVWGPLGGGEGVPEKLQSVLNGKQRFYEKIRRINKKVSITNPWFHPSCKKAELIICKTNDTLDCIPQKYKKKCMTFIETGIHESDLSMYEGFRNRKNENEYGNDFVINAMLRPYKLVPLGVEAFAKVHAKHPESRLHILGDGEDKSKILALMEKHGLQDSVILHGRVSHDVALSIMSSVRGVMITSAREQGSYVMLEAMVLKRPIICFRTSGMAVMVTEKTGVFVEIEEPKKAIADFASAATMLLEDKKFAHQMGENGYQRIVGDLTYSNKMKRLDSILEKL